MSLSGLDDPSVTEAYRYALAEPGGWFVLQYESRDEVKLLARGKQGSNELRDTISAYTDPSPLYAFLHFRRRKVLIKYLPEGCSKIMQVRTNVHFIALTEKFQHDRELPVTQVEDLKDSVLASDLPLHTARRSSRSSSSSNINLKLGGITEDDDESPTTGSQDTPAPESAPSPPVADARPPYRSMLDVGEPTPTINLSLADTTPQESRHSTHHLDFPSDTMDDSLPDFDESRRTSSQTVRPSLSAEYNPYMNLYKPKQKLGPRPSMDKRPATASSLADRPVSSLPPGMRTGFRSGNSNRPVSRDSVRSTRTVGSTRTAVSSAETVIPLPPPIPESPRDSIVFQRPSSSGASIKSMPAMSSRSGKSRMKPEAQRLKKAQELRQRRLAAEKMQQEKAEAYAARQSDSGAERAEESLAAALRTVFIASDPDIATEAPNEDKAYEDTFAPPAEDRAETPTQRSSVVESKPYLPKDILPVFDFEHSESIDEVALKEDVEEARRRDSVAAKEADKQPVQEDLVDQENQSVKVVAPPTSVQEEDAEEPECNLQVDGNSRRSVVDHAKSDSGVDIAATSPISLQASSELASTRPSSISTSINTALPSSPLLKAISIPRGDGSESTIRGLPDVEKESANEESEKSLDEAGHVAESADVNESGSPKESNSDQHVMGESHDSSPNFLTDDSGAVSSVETYQDTSVEPSEPESEYQGPAQDDFSSKRRALVQPIQVDFSQEDDEDDTDTDDSFMEELRSAQVQKATSMVISPQSGTKSPVTPFFPRRTSTVTITPRSGGSGPHSSERLNFFDRPSPDRSPNLGRTSASNFSLAVKRNVSSGLSQRIKALAENSSRESITNMPGSSPNDVAPSLVASRKSTLDIAPIPSRTPTILSRPKRLSVVSLASFKPENNRQNPIRDSPPKVEHGHVKRRSECISVTATIVRNPIHQNPDLSMPTEGRPLELHQSPLVIDHHSADRDPSPPQTANSQMSPSSPASQISMVLPRSSIDNSWRSIGRRMSEARSPTMSNRNLSSTSLETISTVGEVKEDKKSSKTRGFLKRMSSSISSTSRKTLAQVLNPMKEDEPLTEFPPTQIGPMAVGDLNVQFPDTLLWKRRWVEVDNQGNLVFKASKSNESTKSFAKKYHLSSFQKPMIPDQERQEMPNSIILDFTDGSSLQCACSDPFSQTRVLKILQDSHQAWIAT